MTLFGKGRCFRCGNKVGGLTSFHAGPLLLSGFWECDNPDCGTFYCRECADKELKIGIIFPVATCPRCGHKMHRDSGF
jgi:transposase